jgi:hypothetical protein
VLADEFGDVRMHCGADMFNSLTTGFTKHGSR